MKDKERKEKEIKKYIEQWKFSKVDAEILYNILHKKERKTK